MSPLKLSLSQVSFTDRVTAFFNTQQNFYDEIISKCAFQVIGFIIYTIFRTQEFDSVYFVLKRCKAMVMGILTFPSILYKYISFYETVYHSRNQDITESYAIVVLLFDGEFNSWVNVIETVQQLLFVDTLVTHDQCVVTFPTCIYVRWNPQ